MARLKILVPAVLILFSLIYFMYFRSDISDVSLLLVNGTVYTVEPSLPVAGAVAVSGGKIVDVGSTEELRRKYRSSRTIDLKGKAVFPGFIDSHAHIENLGAYLLNLDLLGTASPGEIAGMVKQRAEHLPAGIWIRGRGWDQNDWPQKEFPDHRILDEVAGDIPVYLTRVDGHAVWVNRRVLSIAGITGETPDPPGGRIVRDNRGNPTGIFVDNAVDMLKSILPEPTRAERKEAILRAVRSCSETGLTGVHDMGVDLETLDIYRELIRENSFPLRVYAALSGSGEAWDFYRDHGPEIGTGEGRLTVRALKFYADGALGSYGAALIEPYSDDPSNRGLTLTSSDSLRKYARSALDHGFQFCVHAIGDRANHMVLDIDEEVLRDRKPGTDPRFRIEHAQVLEPSDIPRFAAIGVIPAMQPTHCTSDMYWAETRLGPDRIRGSYAWRSLLDSGSVIPGGSDFPVESNNPLWGFYAAVTRQDHDGWPDGGWHPDQKMTRDEALKSFTIWGAYAAFEEDLKGTVAKGKYADLVVLSDDIMQAPDREILHASVVMTILGGEIVYEPSTVASR